MKKSFLFLLIAMFTLQSGVFAQNINDMIKKASAAMSSVKTCSYDFHSQERFKGGKMITSHVQFKIQESPVRKVYANSILPQKAQLLYVPSVQSKVKVKKGLNLNLELTNGLLMKEQHNTIDRAGFGRMKKVLQISMDQRKGEDYSKYAKVVGSVQYDGKDCYKIEINDPDYKIVNHTVKADETTVWKIGEKLALPEYRIKEINDIDDKLTAGQVIKVPTSYAKKTTIYLDKATYLPLYQKVEDDKGVYEIYEFKNLKVGVTFTDADFTL